MRNIETPLVQQILNKCNSRVNFTRDLTPSSGVKGRYIVSAVDIFKGKNPSMQCVPLELLTKPLSMIGLSMI